MASFNIGKFRTLDNGDLIGAMATATVRMNGVRFLSVRKTKDSQPDYRIVSQGGAEMGAAWDRRRRKMDWCIWVGISMRLNCQRRSTSRLLRKTVTMS